MNTSYIEATALIENTQIKLEKILIRTSKGYEDKMSFSIIQTFLFNHQAN